jgi:hypothetical protein
MGLLGRFKKGDLVRSKRHVGIGIILDIVPKEDEMVQWICRYNYDPMAVVHWWFPVPLEGQGYEDGIDYEYLMKLEKVPD